ncbi:MAG: hypothetical protein A4E73_03305 [Syntrophaceae bacterium PtaU1.Bin231]|nr:MAG: hypothetical protein A4E73_03305 [Syntrophaceae bacterium PtaU1.Bin231]
MRPGALARKGWIQQEAVTSRETCVLFAPEKSMTAKAEVKAVTVSAVGTVMKGVFMPSRCRACLTRSVRLPEPRAMKA